MAKIIAIVTQKGGVGKTTTTINLGACLAAAEKRTLIIDLDPQGNASAGLGIDRERRADPNMYSVLIKDIPIKDVIQRTEMKFLDICPTDSSLSGAPIELVNELARETKLKNAFAKIDHEYDYILIDCAPSVCLLTINALNAADSYLIPMQTEYFAMEGLAQLLNTIKLIKSSLNQSLEMDGILLTMVDSRNNLSKQVTNEVRGHFGHFVYESVIPRNVKLSECPSFGKPVILYDIDSKGSKAYLDFTQEFLNRRFINKSEEQVVQLQ